MSDDLELAALLDRIPVLQGLPRQVGELSGGLTNQNLRVTTERGDYVVRRFRGDTELLGIDRDAEHHNTVAAAEAGVGAPVVDYSRDLGVLVIAFLDGRTYDNDCFSEPGAVERAARACRTLHAGPAFRGRFDMFTRQPRYLATARERDFPLLDGYDDHADAFDRARAALAVRAREPVPCNNDLLAGNYIDDGERLWLIDYEYSGQGDDCFELGNTCTECDLDGDQVEALVTAYDGELLRHRLARVRLQMLVSAYGWTLWGLIQAAASPLDFDFTSWAQERFDKAARGFTADDYSTLLEEAARDD